MMVNFISQCEKNALKKTRRVLDSFANRIGDNVWQTVITEEGLLAVKKLLRKTASKNTAVSCHWIRSRSRSDLLWVVGRRDKFNSEGVVPVNSTQNKLINSRWENDWHYLPLIKALVALAALLHDWGKSTLLFQEKLKLNSKLGDPLRHEWVSCLLLKSLIVQSTDFENDEAWLVLLSNGVWDESKLKEIIKDDPKPLENLPPIAQLVAWLIVTHHRLPALWDEVKRKSYSEVRKDNIQSLLKIITADWGYRNNFNEAEYKNRLKKCFEFPQGLLNKSEQWVKNVKKWSARLLQEKPQVEELFRNGAWRVVLHHARLCLMLGDHYYSSCDADKNWESDLKIYANTNHARELKQKLDEHLVKVSQYSLEVSQSLARFSTEMGSAYDVKSLKQKSPKGYEWQDAVVDSIQLFQKKYISSSDKHGWFIVNMASTGCGKTIANSKIMRALSDDGKSLRYILALGLRTLTLQTGDEYRDKIGLQGDELAVLIGSAAIKELHEKDKLKKLDEKGSIYAEWGSESAESLLDEDLDYDNLPTADFLDAIIPEHKPKLAEKNKAFLYKPVLACTIDHIITATEATRGGKYILPCLRLLSSDLVIDEVDDFDGQDLIAIGRLIHLAGMLGRKVMISSATIPPALAEGFFNAYQSGWRLYSNFKKMSQRMTCAWVDEFSTHVDFVDQTDASTSCTLYKKLHQKFVFKRVEDLKKQSVKRMAYIINCDDLYQKKKTTKDDQETIEEQYFEKIKETVIALHSNHHTVDYETGKKVSFGVVRVANITPCINLSKYLLNTNWSNKFSPKIMAYHSRQVLLLRHEQEHHLDTVLKRKEKKGEIPSAFHNPFIRAHLDSALEDNIIFILVATPVEEVGRDHDFDWAVIEPSSFRSIIQLSGRVRRHRTSEITTPNIGIMQYNLKALRQDAQPAFWRPGYETFKTLRLATHDLKRLVDEEVLMQGINSIPRIQQLPILQPREKLVDLEHQALIDCLKNYTAMGPQNLQGWLNGCWWMTALPQQFNRFRAGMPERLLYLLWKNDQAVFHEKDEQGNFIKTEEILGISHETAQKNEMFLERKWLHRSYKDSLQRLCAQENKSDFLENYLSETMRLNSERYGEISFPEYDKDKQFIYSDQFGLFKPIN